MLQREKKMSNEENIKLSSNIKEQTQNAIWKHYNVLASNSSSHMLHCIPPDSLIVVMCARSLCTAPHSLLVLGRKLLIINSNSTVFSVSKSAF